MVFTGEKKREYQRQWLAARRAEWFKDKVCIDCGYVKNLELDHVDPSVKVTHKVWSWSAERRNAELAKCVARCTDCHKKRTKTQTTTRTHGTTAMYYSSEKCRCEMCRSAKAAYRLVRKTKGLNP